MGILDIVHQQNVERRYIKRLNDTSKPKFRGPIRVEDIYEKKKEKKFKFKKKKRRNRKGRKYNNLQDGKEKYQNYLLSAHWRELRNRIRLERVKCEGCNSIRDLNVHHGTYINVGKEKENELFLVCQDCHKGIHELHKVGRKKDLRFSLMIATLQYLKNKNRKFDDPNG